jgi:hypothetical protein
MPLDPVTATPAIPSGVIEATPTINPDGGVAVHITGGSTISTGDSAADASLAAIQALISGGHLSVADATAAGYDSTTATATAALAAIISGGKLQVTDSALSAAAPTPAAYAALYASETLPAAGAYDAALSGGSAGIAVPLGTVGDQTRAVSIVCIYTQGTSGGQAAVIIEEYDGNEWGQVPEPIGQTFTGYNLGSGTGVYIIHMQLDAGMTRIGLRCAEVGVPGTPGTMVAHAVFG